MEATLVLLILLLIAVLALVWIYYFKRNGAKYAWSMVALLCATMALQMLFIVLLGDLGLIIFCLLLAVVLAVLVIKD